MDSPLEEGGFEPPVPSCDRTAPLAMEMPQEAKRTVDPVAKFLVKKSE